ncbi:sigma-70 family RNA polymerase sigma factor [Cesiribacter sp. SM1]|uniref:sigma-70 family RNA polymerase sigma factor n=1 Tax=Cesiribacter sp. SM1 TaxID=2861196 RepID=UPI001CD64182|nr:sigma-70 family RNA polymerase sigma factor [Cesiribacter sp. SM1]
MDYALLQDSELLELVREKEDNAAFREIYVRYWKEVFTLAYKKLRSKELAEELTQNIFVSLWERRVGHGVQHLRSWLLGALKFSIINQYKSQMVHEKYVSYSHSHAKVASDATEQQIFLKDLSEAVELGVALLPVKTQKVFKLSRIENRTVKEISQTLNISEKAVEYHITQSLKVMKVHLKEYLLLLILFLHF